MSMEDVSCPKSVGSTYSIYWVSANAAENLVNA